MLLEVVDCGIELFEKGNEDALGIWAYSYS